MGVDVDDLPAVPRLRGQPVAIRNTRRTSSTVALRDEGRVAGDGTRAAAAARSATGSVRAIPTSTRRSAACGRACDARWSGTRPRAARARRDRWPPTFATTSRSRRGSCRRAALYDTLGSALFDAICHLPWYPVTRAERRLHRRASRRDLRRGRQIPIGSWSSAAATATS